MQPDIVYQSPLEAAEKKKFTPSFRAVIPLVVIALILAYLSLVSPSNFGKFFNQTTPKQTLQAKKLTPADFRKALVKDIQTSFKSSKDAGVMAYIDLASLEKDAYQSYQYYVKAFHKMSDSYLQSKKEPISTDSARERLNQKIAMIELKAYATSLKYYKESDFILPK